ncbi:methylene-tetrahydromethanopterin reductase [Saccharopolyspora subtropica]|uniref:LLM class flavin-dependent oxidoreductase n=1 Tax=Saccharopolyspora thermophila TaxID=89367 RepID=A0A917K164_9PSEU|nr:LLM class flavin-dependent oxidoreductase [Saccharopolyspora subtropica]GGI94284.1 methylene-tetrahydromethanopterin reductase [Saccharopolyspora subtropica]
MTARLSVLDRSHLSQGRSPQQALRDTVRFAQEVEALGYHRFWVAEHHGVPGVAGSAPTVLAAAVAAATSRIRVGTGGVMLPNHQPLVVAEQFGVLGSLFPGRIDVGLGRSVGFTSGIRRALGRDKDAADGFGDQLAELLGYLVGRPEAHPGVHAVAAEGVPLPVFVLATGSGADLAAEFGLPLVIAAVRGDERMARTIDAYRAGFRPSAWADEPYVIVAKSVAVADTAERARRLLVPEAWALAQSRTRGEFPPLEPPEQVLAREMSDRERAEFERALQGHVYGTPHEVALALKALHDRTGADELLVTTTAHDPRDRLASYRALAELTGISA